MLINTWKQPMNVYKHKTILEEIVDKLKAAGGLGRFIWETFIHFKLTSAGIKVYDVIVLDNGGGILVDVGGQYKSQEKSFLFRRGLGGIVHALDAKALARIMGLPASSINEVNKNRYIIFA